MKIISSLDDNAKFERTLHHILSGYKVDRLPLIYIPREYRTPTKIGFKYSSL